MNAGDALKLSADIVLVPCADLDDQLRGRFTFAAGDVTLTHLHGRVHSQVIDGNTAALLALFREPRTIVDAVLESSRALGKEPRAWLDEQMPILDRFVHSRVLIPAGSDDDGAVRPRYDSGAAVTGWKVVRCISLFEDTEVYHLRNGDAAAALKIARRAGPALQPLFENEAEILRELGVPKTEYVRERATERRDKVVTASAIPTWYWAVVTALCGVVAGYLLGARRRNRV